MLIEQLSVEQADKLHAFRKKEWPKADQEHYGATLPDFDKKKAYFIAKEQDEIVGYISYTLEAGVGSIGSIIVSEDHRGKGIATKLFNKAEEALKQQGAHKVWLETGKEWKAKHLYKKLGYTTRTTLPHHYGEQDFILMDKKL